MRKGAAFLKYTWEDEDGKLQADWDRVSEVEFVADKAGKFTFSLQPRPVEIFILFMTGELIVRPNTSLLSFLFPYPSGWCSACWSISEQIAVPAFRAFNTFNLLEKLPWLKKIFKLRSFQFLIISA